MKMFLQDLFTRERTPLADLSFIFCSDDYLIGINTEFLNHDTYTDIITFDLTESHALPNAPDSKVPGARNKTRMGKTGEIYVSTERVVDNAEKLGVDRKDELRRVMIHGCLHLCGYKDKLKDQQAVMRRKEDQYLSLYKRRST